MSIREYARQRGVSQVAIHKAVKAGKIPLTENGLIDPVAADTAWEDNRSPQQHTHHTGSTVPEPKPNERTYADARNKREYLRLEREALELKKVRGGLQDTVEVEREARIVANQVREGMLAIPDRVASLIAAESDASKVHAVLAAEIRQALIAVAEQIDVASVQ